MRNKLIAFAILLSLGCMAINAQDKKTDLEERYFEINKNIEIYNSILRELDIFYVDTVDVSKAVRGSIDYMLNTLDPYTEYFNQDDMKDFKVMTSGEYAGIGSGIVYKDKRICITEPFENSPADKAGLKPGDYIIEIDGKDMTKCDAKEGEAYGQTLSSYVSSHLKGEPGTSIKVKVERLGSKKPVTLKVTRERIEVDIIPYYGMLNEKVGYISLNSFTEKSSERVKKAFQELKKQNVQSLIFDLRNNPGGIMENAIEIVNMFVPKGKTVVSTKGKIKQWDRTYRTTVEPIDPEIPIVVLINQSSASASEIVAGALQDMDRAVLIGERTFGKGLVQSPREIPYDGSVKITTSKYYIPSGRCVQAIDYSHRNSDGSVGRIPDSLTTVFHTEIGREVRDGGGVSPDIESKEEKAPNITFYLSNQFIVFDWVSNWVLKNKSIASPKEFSITDEDYNSFKEFVKTKDFKYDKISEKTMTSLKEVMEFEGYMKTAEEEFKALEAKLVPDLDRDLELFKKEITEIINAEIIKRYYYQKGGALFAIRHDAVVDKALEVISDQDLYKETLSVKEPVETEEAETTTEK